MGYKRTISVYRTSDHLNCIRPDFLHLAIEWYTPIQWVSLHPSDRRPTDVVSLHCPSMIFRLKEPARFYIHFMSRDRPIDDSGPILFQLISVRTCLFMFSCFAVGIFRTHPGFISCFGSVVFSEILLQHHFLEMGALMSPLTLMALIRTN